MTKLIHAFYNMDTNSVELTYNDGSVLTIDCEKVENHYDVTNGQMADLDWLLYNAAMEYAMQPVQSIPSRKEKRHPFWSDLYYQEREAVGPEQYLGADEIPLRGSRSKSQQGVSPQSAQAVCPDFLRY